MNQTSKKSQSESNKTDKIHARDVSQAKIQDVSQMNEDVDKMMNKISQMTKQIRQKDESSKIDKELNQTSKKSQNESNKTDKIHAKDVSQTKISLQNKI